MATRYEIEDLTHDHMFLGSAHDANARRTLWVVGLTAVMMVGEIVAGYATGSMALLADGFHMATHAGALGVAAAAYAYAKRHVHNPAFSFGTGKVGDLAGFASALVLALIALAIGVESAVRLLTPVSVQFGEATVIAVIGLGVNIASAMLLSGGHHHGHGHGHDHGHGHAHGHGHDHDHHHDGHHGHDHQHHDHHDHHDRGAARGGDGHAAHGQDNALRSAYIHVLADALTSVLAIAALLAGRYLGWVWLDPAMGIVGAIVIARWAWTLMRDTAAILLDRTDRRLAERARGLVEADGGVRITDLHVWRVGPEAHAAIVSVVASPEVDTAAIRRRLAPLHAIAHLTIERN